MASFDTLQQLASHPDWIAPRSDVRVFIGEPGAPEATKTTIEPGNVFSPGMYTFGVTWWLRLPDTGAFFATETAPLDALRWQYEGGHLPVIHCDVNWSDLSIRHTLFQDGTAAERAEAVAARLQLTASQAQTVQVFVALRSLGPAGGPLNTLDVDERGFSRNHLPLLAFDRSPSATGCGVGDPSPLARQGHVPNETSVKDDAGWCYGLARFDVQLLPGETWVLRFDCPIQTRGNLQRELPSQASPRPEQFEARMQNHLESWRARLHNLDLNVPDSAFRDAFFAGLQHMLTAVVGEQARIAPLSYPLAWLRDSIYIIRCFDLAGWHDIARAATEYCVRNDFFGGFGAEGDAPGQGIWAIVQHYRVTRSREWLRRVYPAVQRKCDWLFKMRRATSPIQVFTDTPVLAFTHAERTSGVICLPASDGIIMGTMDHGVDYALGWVNQWALAGLREAAYAARELGFTGDAARYDAEALELHQALAVYAQQHPAFFDHERTVNSLIWPTHAWDADAVHAAFMRWWHDKRWHNKQYQPEPYWLYFELAQAHNALLLGELKPVWEALDFRLNNQDLPGLYGWREGGNGVGTDNAIHGVTLIPMLRGCHRFDSITPHGWSQAEMWLLQRAVLVEEWQSGLLLFGGVPSKWLQPGQRVAFRAFPTCYGRVSAQLQVAPDGYSANVTVEGAAEGTPLYLHLGNSRVEDVARAQSTVMTIQLR